jgi:hypothetical protein
MNQRKNVYNYKIVCCLAVFLSVLFLDMRPAWSEGGKDTGDEKFNFEDLLGKPTKNQIYLGMFTYHFDPKSRRNRNWNQALVGFQYKDFFVCTFMNSFDDRSWAAGFARNYYTRELNDAWDLTLGGRLGLLYGYKDGQAPFSSVSSIIPMIEVYSQFICREHYGIEIMMTTSLSVSFFYQF